MFFSHHTTYSWMTLLPLLAVALTMIATKLSSAFSPISIPLQTNYRHHHHHHHHPIRIISTTTKLGATTSNSDSSGGGFDTSFMWNAGLNFGKGDFKFYNGFDQWMSVFPDEDRQAFPEIFNLPTGVYEVRIPKPLGIVFEEIDAGKGLYVKELVEGGNAAQEGTIQPGDNLVAITAVKIVGAKYERRLIPCRGFDFDTMVGAVESNEPKWSCDDVILMVERPGQADPKAVDRFLEFFAPPFDNPWRQRQ